MRNLSLHEIVSATNGIKLSGPSELIITAISSDTRKITPGSLFVALQGEHFDGHDFIYNAISSGAIAILANRKIEVEPQVAVIQVPDTLEAFGKIASYYRQFFSVPVIGITGSNGKTTTKDLLASILEQRLSIIKTEANFNNEVGLPLTLLKMDDTTEAAVVEMGMRGVGQIRHLAGFAKPTIGIITNVGLSHLELLGSQANIAKAKGELVQALPGNGLAVLNGDDPQVRAMKKISPARTVLYGIETPGLDYRVVDIKIRHNGCRFQVYTRNETFEITLPIPGKHNVLNALAAIAVAKEMSIDNEAIKKGLENPGLTDKRLKITAANGYWVIDDTYNASPTSLKAALDVVSVSEVGLRKIAVLADMLELGPKSAEIHRELGEYAANRGVHLLLTVGDLAREFVNGFNKTHPEGGEHFARKSDLIERLKALSQPNDLILVKGSRSMKMEDVVAALTKEEAK